MARPIRKREHLEAGVARVVAQRGLHAVTIQDIAAAAKVSPGLLYRYWKGRDELALDIYRRYHQQLLDRLESVAAPHADVWDKLRAALRSFLTFADEHPVELKFLLLSQHDLGAKIPSEGGVHTWLLRMISAGIAQGRIRPLDPDLACQLAIGVVLQPVLGVVYGRLPGPVRGLEAELYAALERLLNVPEHKASLRRPRRAGRATVVRRG